MEKVMLSDKKLKKLDALKKYVKTGKEEDRINLNNVAKDNFDKIIGKAIQEDYIKNDSEYESLFYNQLAINLIIGFKKYRVKCNGEVRYEDIDKVISKAVYFSKIQTSSKLKKANEFDKEMFLDTPETREIVSRT